MTTVTMFTSVVCKWCGQRQTFSVQGPTSVAFTCSNRRCQMAQEQRIH